MPEFSNDKEIADFWDTHSFQDYLDDTKEGEIEFVRKPKKALTVRLAPEDIEMVRKLANYKGLSYTALIRMWVKEKLRKEIKELQQA